jgi:hypothetical protein
MARIEFPEETRKRIEQVGSADLVIGISGAVNGDALRTRAEEALTEWRSANPAVKIAVAYPGTETAQGEEHAPATDGLAYIPYPMPGSDPSLVPWVAVSSAQRSVLALAVSLQAKTCVVMHADLTAMNSQILQSLTGKVLEGSCDLVMPIYPTGKYDGLINKRILAPLTRALYGKRVQSPLVFDFSASARVSPQLADADGSRLQGGPQLLWPSNLVAMDSGQIGQILLDLRHATQADGLELSGVLSQVVGSLFSEMETYAAHWQRMRGSQATPVWGMATPPEAIEQPIDARPLFESFLLGSRNLEEVWRLVLPPVTLLELKRLTRLQSEQFRMPDELWAKIVYDFALAHRLRNISRTHLLGALTPLYLGWVASYTQEVGNATFASCEQRLEHLARAFEDNKPYLVSRWRWPDRFNP